MSNRRQRRLDHLKTQKGKIDKGYPKKEEARQGHSVTKFIEGKGLYEFTYYNNQWYSKKLDTANQADSTFSSEVRTNNLVVEPGGSVNMKGAQSIKGIKAEDIQNTPLAGTVTPGYIGQIGALKFSLPATEPGQIGFNNESQEFELKRSEDDKLVYDGTNLKSVRNVNDGNPTFQLGASDTECFKIETTYTSGGKSLSNVVINTLTAGTDADLGKITFKIDEARHTILEDSGLRLYGKTFTINDSADTGDIFKIETTTHGATTMSTVDDDAAAAHLTLDIDGQIKLKALDGAADSIQFNLASNTFASFQAEDGSYSQLRLYENGGESSDDYLQIKCEEHGATTIVTHDNAAAAANLSFDIDGDILLDSRGHTTIDSHQTIVLDSRDTAGGGKGTIFKHNGTETGFINQATLNLKEAASSPGIEQEYGQLWVKNDTPTNLYFRDDVGNNVQLTNNGATVDNRWRYHQNARFYTRFDNWYYPSTVYGMNSVNWSSTSSSSTKRTTWLDSYNPCLVITDDITLTEYYFYGNFTSSQTYELCMLKGTGVTYGSAGNYSLSAIGSTQSVSATGNILYKIGETGLSVSLSAGDIIIPALRRTTTDTSTYYYFEFSMNLKGVYV